MTEHARECGSAIEHRTSLTTTGNRRSKLPPKMRFAIVERRADGRERGVLRVVDRLLPAARKERRVGAEQQPVRPGDGERLPEHRSSVRPGWYFIQPFELDVSRWMLRALVGRHQRFAEQAGAEVRHDHRHRG